MRATVRAMLVLSILPTLAVCASAAAAPAPQPTFLQLAISCSNPGQQLAVIQQGDFTGTTEPGTGPTDPGTGIGSISFPCNGGSACNPAKSCPASGGPGCAPNTTCACVCLTWHGPEGDQPVAVNKCI